MQVDVAPQGLNGGMQVADLHVRADAKLTAEAVTKKLKELGKTKAAIRTPELAKRIKDEPADTNTFSVEPGLLDPRAVIAELDRVIPKDYDSVSGSGHQSYFHTVMRGRPPEKYFAVRDFGAIGNSISLAMGVAMARKDGKTVLFEGDGSLLMHIQELEVMQRHGIKLLMCIMNDGAYGAEIHKLRARRRRRQRRDLRPHRPRRDRQGLRAARPQHHRRQPDRTAVQGLRGAGQGRNLELPGIRQGRESDDAARRAPRPRQDVAMGAITEQGIFGVVCAVLGVVAGIYLSRMIKRRQATTAQKKRDATPPSYASRQEMRKAEREKAKRG